MPTYSVILPVRNGGEYVKACVQSVLAQNFQDFELLILENGSTDGTDRWLADLNDPRIRVFPSSGNLGIAENWARILSLKKAEFMTMIGHDDLLAPDFLEEMNSLIISNPEASLYLTHFNYINSVGGLIRKCRPLSAAYYFNQYLEAILQDTIDINGTGYVVRASLYDAVGGIPLFPNLLFSDFALWLECIKPSFLAVSEKNCFSYRLHQSMTSVSSDSVMHLAFSEFIHYLNKIKSVNKDSKALVEAHGSDFIRKYCISFSHRLLRHDAIQRGGKTVRGWVDECKELSDLINPGQGKKLENNPMVRMSLLVDRFKVIRKVFLTLRRMIPGPVLK